MSDERDRNFMRRALTLAARGRHTHPNPQVGAVVVQNGAIVGEGWHKGVGTPHAEAVALEKAGDRARNATIYVTLEPCSHWTRADGTPRLPCVARCLDAGVARVVAAMPDPDRQVNGQGLNQLRAAGIAVTVGLEEAAARALNAPYIRHRETLLPSILHKAAMTLDGKIAAVGGDARWVTGEEARLYVHRLRDRADALIVGVGTILADDPELTTRLPQRRNVHHPLRVIIDSGLRTPVEAKIARSGTLILTTETENTLRKSELEERGVEIVALPSDDTGRVNVLAAARLLADRGALSILLESGGTLAASFWQAGLVNRVLFFIAPRVVGGRDAPTPVDGDGIARRMAEAVQLDRFRTRLFGMDVALEGEVRG